MINENQFSGGPVGDSKTSTAQFGKTVARAESCRSIGDVMRWVQELGLQIAPSSRFAQYFKLLEEDVRGGCPKGGSIELARANLEIAQLGVILESGGRVGPREEFVPKLRDVLSGHCLPHDEGAHAPARDYQLELYLAGLFTRAGVSTRLGEPDLVVEIEGVGIGVAAKRIKSRRAFGKRLCNALNQVRRACAEEGIEYGIACIDVSLVVLQEKGVCTFPCRGDANSWFQERHDDFEGLLSSTLSRCTQPVSPPLIGVLLVTTGQALDRSAQTLVNHTVLSSYSVNPETRHYLSKLRRRVENGVRE